MYHQNLKSLISVIVPIYNVEDYLPNCIESIKNQTHKNLEIILVDDGSTDTSGEICDKYANNDPRIIVIHKRNGGLVSARKSGIQRARGKYATYVDGDDWISPVMYENLLSRITDADIIISGKIRDYGNHLVYEKNKIPDGIYSDNDLKAKIYSTMMYTGIFYDRGISPQIYQNLYIRTLLLKNQLEIPDQISVGEDAACTYPTLLNANKIAVTSDCYYHYRIRAGSIMDININDDISPLSELYKYLKKRFSEKAALESTLLNQLDYMMLYILMLKKIPYMQHGKGIFPYSGIEKGDKIAIYGTGRFGKELAQFIEKQGQYSIVACLDSSKENENIECLKNLSYDYIIIAVLIQEIADEIMNYLISMGIQERKIKQIDMNEIELAKTKLADILRYE